MCHWNVKETNSNKRRDKILMLSLNEIGWMVSDNSFKSFDFRKKNSSTLPGISVVVIKTEIASFSEPQNGENSFGCGIASCWCEIWIIHYQNPVCRAIQLYFKFVLRRFWKEQKINGYKGKETVKSLRYTRSREKLIIQQFS